MTVEKIATATSPTISVRVDQDDVIIRACSW
jgi:hypothetical protein